MTMSASPEVLNQLFSAHLDSPEGKEKIAAVARSYVRDRLRENSFMRKILPPQQVTKADMQVSVNHDTMVYIDEIEPNSRAMTLTFRGQPTARYIRAQRYEIPVFTISSERFEKTEQELLSYKMAITKVIEDNSVKDIQEIEDHRGLTYIEAAVTATSQIVRGEQAEADADAFGSGNGLRGTVQRGDFIKLFKELDGKRRRLSKILINEEDWDDVMAWTIEDFGDSVQSKVVVDGYSYDKILGRMVIRTVKTDILQTGNIYGFTSPEFLGKFLILNSTKFYIDKVANLIMWQAWEDIGMAFGNIASIAKLELYNGQGGGDDGSDPLISEEDIASPEYTTRYIDEGITYPAVYTY
jgi:hypothetical protein